MMSSNNNFLLKIHMEEENNITEIYLNKERRSFTFVNDECISDLIIPEFKITSLNMILKNISDSNGDDTYYAEYEKNNEIVREYDKEKIHVLSDLITKISINDFIDYQKDIKINDYYVDNIIDAYECVIPTEMKKILSYTTNGVVFNGEEIIYFMPHEDITSYMGPIQNFIPFMIRNGKSQIGYDYKESLYKEFLEDELINEGKTLKDIIGETKKEIEILELDDEESDLVEEVFSDYNEEEQEKVAEEYENTIKNIDYQFERLNNGIVHKEKKEQYIYKEKKPKEDEEAKIIKQEIRTAVRKSLDELEKTNDIIDEIDNDIERVIKKAEKITANKKKKEEPKTVISDEIGKEAEKVLEKLNAEIAELEKAKQKAKKEHVLISNEIGKEAEKVLEKLNAEIAKMKKTKKKEKTQKVVMADEIGREAEAILEKLNIELAKIEEEKQKNQREKVKAKKEKEEKTDILSLSELINNSIDNALDNYKVNVNDTQKLVVEHLPYYEFNNDFNVIQIPEIDLDKITLLPDSVINLDKLKLVVKKLSKDKVDLLVQSATSIVDKDGNKIKKGDHLVLDLENEIALRLNKKSAMETWSIRMEKSTFEKELRNIDFKKIMNYIVELDSYSKLGNVEKYELQKSVMLFIDLVMENKEEKILYELYKILEKKPNLYEEFITKYNNKKSLELKDSLSTYDEKKSYLTKLNYVNGLIEAKWLDYPRYIFNSHNYFYGDEFLEEFINELDSSLTEKDFYNYLIGLFNEYEMFIDLDEEGQKNLEKCIEYLSILYKYRPDLGEDNKYKIERTFMIGATEEEMSLLISKLCRRGIKDYSIFVEYDAMMKEKYRLGELKYPIYTEYFEIEEIRNGGEYDEF